MPTQTFPCPFCSKKMGVGSELLGKKVRCPHCNRILVAPIPAAATPPPPVPVLDRPTPPDLPVFNLPSQEARESIFGEPQDEGDDVFSSSDVKKKFHTPDVPPPDSVEPSVAEPKKPRDPAYDPTVEMNSPFTGIAAPILPEQVPPPVLVPIPVPAPIPTVAPIGATPPSSPGANPWAGLDELAAPVVVPALVPVPVPGSPFSDTTEEASPRKKRSRDGEAGGGNPLFKLGFYILAPYALIATVLAAYGLFFKSRTPAGHPLSTLPDNFGEYAPAERKKTGKLAIPVDGELPPGQKVALGGKLEIGQLEIEPFRIEQRKLTIVTEGKLERPVSPGTTPAIVLRMRIKNVSDDLQIHPLDPAFNRRIVDTEQVGTGLVAGKKTHWGGAIGWPFAAGVSRVYEAAQEADAVPLKPGESREYVVFTNASQSVVKSVREAREPLLWRVQVRRGRIEFNGKDVPVTAIIGVEFKAGDVNDAE